MIAVEKIALKYRTSVALLLVGWLLLCGLMPLLHSPSVDPMVDPHANHHMMAGHHVEAADTADAPHCCDVLQGHQLPVHYPFMDLLTFAIIGFLLFSLVAVLPSPPKVYYAPVPPTGPPLHQRNCVWLD